MHFHNPPGILTRSPRRFRSRDAPNALCAVLARNSQNIRNLAPLTMATVSSSLAATAFCSRNLRSLSAAHCACSDACSLRKKRISTFIHIAPVGLSGPAREGREVYKDVHEEGEGGGGGMGRRRTAERPSWPGPRRRLASSAPPPAPPEPSPPLAQPPGSPAHTLQRKANAPRGMPTSASLRRTSGATARPTGQSISGVNCPTHLPYCFGQETLKRQYLGKTTQSNGSPIVLMALTLSRR